MSTDKYYYVRKAASVFKRTVFTSEQLLRHTFGNIPGFLQQKIGREPTIIFTSRMALEQWKYRLQDVAPPSKGKVAIFATRNQRWVEWAVFSACYILQMGYEPVVLYSTQEIADIYESKNLFGKIGFNFWKGIDNIPYIRRLDLDTFLSEDNDNYIDFAIKYAHMVAAYDLRVEEYEGEDTGEYEQTVHGAERMLAQYGQAAEHTLRSIAAKRLICPSGLIGRSLAVREAAGKLGLTSVFVEGWAMRPGHLIWNVDRPALEYDIDGWMKVLGEWDEQKEAEAQQFMIFREGGDVSWKGWLDNFHSVQRSSKHDPLPAKLASFLKRSGPFFLLGTNVIGDSATLGRATIFRSQHDWIRQVVEFFKQNPQLNLIIRAHPDEVWARARQRIGDLAQILADGMENVYVVDGSDNVNTYALVSQANVGLAWVSNIGLDMALRGKPVIIAAKAQYANLGLCRVPSTREEYFRSILEIVEDPPIPDAAAIVKGKAYHHIVFKMMSLEADSKRYLARDYRLGNHNPIPDQDLFYRILVGDISEKGNES